MERTNFGPDAQQQLNMLLEFLGINPRRAANLQWTVRPSARFIELHDIEPDDYRFDAAQAELRAMTEDERDVRELSWDEVIIEGGTVRGKLPRQVRVRLLPVVE